MTIMDSMTDAELDSKDVKKLLSDQARIDRLARGSGRRRVGGGGGGVGGGGRGRGSLHRSKNSNDVERLRN